MYFAYHDSNSQKGVKFDQINMNKTYNLYRRTKEETEKEFSEKRVVEAEAACRHWELSGKLRVLASFLQDWIEKDPTTKVLIFSQTKKILDIIERLAKHKSFSYLRMDGNVSLKSRVDLIKKFN